MAEINTRIVYYLEHFNNLYQRINELMNTEVVLTLNNSLTLKKCKDFEHRKKISKTIIRYTNTTLGSASSFA